MPCVVVISFVPGYDNSAWSLGLDAWILGRDLNAITQFFGQAVSHMVIDNAGVVHFLIEEYAVMDIADISRSKVLLFCTVMKLTVLSRPSAMIPK